MAKKFFKRLFGRDDQTEPEKISKEVTIPTEDLSQIKQTPIRQPMIELQINFYGNNQATVEVLEQNNQTNVIQHLRLTQEYYANTLYRLGSSEASQQLQQYVAALCYHLLENGELKRINILGDLHRLVITVPQDTEPQYSQNAVLFRNPDQSFELEVFEPQLPLEHFLPISMILLLQHMLYTLSDEYFAELLMSFSAMHTFYTLRYNYYEPEGHRLAVLHALQQLQSHHEYRKNYKDHKLV